ncbi:hypothetical protein [Streptomyces sp. CB03911]|nr:hypothetical protein [Streptomyces sp. CB03911]
MTVSQMRSDPSRLRHSRIDWKYSGIASGGSARVRPGRAGRGK